jgi:hypothetical protein
MLSKRLRNLQSYTDWPKVKPNEILVVPKDNRLLEHPPFRNSAGWPDWFKKAGKNSVAVARCKGIQDYLSLGITVPLWGDVKIHPTEGGGTAVAMADSFFSAEQFDAEMTKGCPFMEDRPVEHAGCPDLRSPFLYKTAPGYSLLCLPVLYEPDPRYQVLPSVINTDYFHRVNVALKVLSDEEFIIPTGTPICHLIPFKRNDKVKKVIMGDEYMHSQASNRGIGVGGFQTFRRSVLYRKHQRQYDGQ